MNVQPITMTQRILEEVMYEGGSPKAKILDELRWWNLSEKELKSQLDNLIYFGYVFKWRRGNRVLYSPTAKLTKLWGRRVL
jgi:hypothetical protein